MTTLTSEDTMEILALAAKLRDLCQRTGAGVGISAGPGVAIDGFVTVSLHCCQPDVGDAVGEQRTHDGHVWTAYTLCGVPVDVFSPVAAGAK